MWKRTAIWRCKALWAAQFWGGAVLEDDCTPVAEGGKALLAGQQCRKELCASFGSAALQVSIDSGHARFAHGSTGTPAVGYFVRSAFVRSAGAMLVHVHLQDGDDYADRHQWTGRGNILWPSLRHLLRWRSNRA